MKGIMLKDFDGRFSDDDLQTFFAVSAFLDLRFKTLAFREECPRQVTVAKVKEVLSQNEQDRAMRPPIVKQEPDVPPLPSLGNLTNTVAEEPNPEAVEPDAKRIKTEPNQEPVVEKKVSFFNDLFITKVEGPKFTDELIAKEVERYLTEDVTIPTDANGTAMPEKFDILDWWQQRLSTYPRLSKIARKYLCCPATSVPSERLFSSAGNLINKKRCCLKAENVDKLLFLHKNW